MSRQMTTSAFHKSKTLDNKYMLGDEIGKGAYGRVYKGLDLENGDFVAIKQVSLENIAQEDLNIIMQEIDLLKNLNHKNIVKYLGSLKTKTHLHIILEYVENGSLANIVKPNKFGPFPESLVAVYIAQVLEGLVYLHEQGVIHRDIKGANILTTKEGLVKLADFGVATKLNEADVNTHSVVGTPYWMAPEVIEMSGVCAASDIWSVGCTVIELLTCVPPYYDLQPMPALFRIVQDEHPPIPDSLSPAITDFLRQCFKKDARQRPDAKTLLSHPWILNSRHALQTSIRHSGTLRNIEEVGPGDAESSRGEQRHDIDTSSAEKEFKTELLSSEAAGISKSFEDDVSNANRTEERADNLQEDVISDQVPTFSIHEKLHLQTSSNRLVDDHESSSYAENKTTSNLDQHGELLTNGELKPPESTKTNAVATKFERDGSSVAIEHGIFSFGQKSQDYSPRKAVKASINSGGNELSRFSDPPNDASLDDLFHPLEYLEDQIAEASTSASSSHVNGGNTVYDSGRNDLATKLRATIAQKQMENESAQANGGDIIRLMMGVLKEDGIDIDTLGFEDTLPAENLFHLQAVEFSKLVSSLRPDEPEDVIVSACQKLTAFFHQRPEQKIVLITQHGLLSLMELLEVPSTRVICLVLQVLNQIIKDNTEFQENACLVGLIPVVMSLAAPDRIREVRLEAACFLQQLCQSSSSTLEMFIACRGIPILVGFLEADYAKYREMVHMAIDGMWQVFKLQKSTSRNDFCHIAAKNGILLRLVNTLYSLNEATRLASIAIGGGLPPDGLAPRPKSGPLDSSSPSFVQMDTSFYGFDQPDHLKVKQGDQKSQAGLQEPSRASVSHSPESRFFSPDADRPPSSIATMEASGASKVPDPALLDRGSNPVIKDHLSPFRDREIVDRWKNEPSRAEVEVKQQRGANTAGRTSTDRAPKSAEAASNGSSAPMASQQENVRPLLSLLDKEPPSSHFSGQLEYVRHITGMEKHESGLPLFHASGDKKTNGLDFLTAEFAEVSGRGRENSNVDSLPRSSPKAASKKLGPLTSGAVAVTSGLASRTASGVLSGSGVLSARPGSTTSSGLLSHMVSPWNVDVAREYLEKVADLLLEFAVADTAVKSYMCSQSLLCRLFQMFNKIEPPILLKLLKCVNHLSTDPHCLEHLQRADTIKYLIPNLDLKEGSLVPQIYHEVLNALFNLCKINKRRQEQAAENGIIPHLMQFIISDSPLKQYALPLLCDMAHASRNSREQLRAHGGLDVYLSLLEDELWSVTALDSIAVCLAHDNENRKVEQALLKKEAVQKLVKFFQCCTEQYFLHILEPFLKIITYVVSYFSIWYLCVCRFIYICVCRLINLDYVALLLVSLIYKMMHSMYLSSKN
ncbi:hypothetical protein Pfo_024546 [Paulownia fortunei]|nr:hypothetical protein Pfo_024546 [Paulownia fortunei]